MKVEDIINICKGKLFSGDINLVCNNFSKDTRTIQEGDIYIGIKGETFDGNSFYEKAFEKGASACILEESYKKKIKKTDKTIIIVKDSIRALKNLAEAKLEKAKISIVAITGSVGKTSTRDMIYSILSRKYKTLVTEGNYNNDIGLPLTVLRLKDEEVIILEMGMNHKGEIKYLSDMVKPDIAVITNVLPVHIEYLGNMENILNAKMEIKSGLKENGVLIINNDNEYLHQTKSRSGKIVTCGIKNSSDFKAEIMDNKTYKVKIENEQFYFSNPIGTKPYILNALLAIAVGIELNVNIKDIQLGLSEYKLTSERLEILKSKKGVKIIDDSYNASAESMINSLEFTLNQEGFKKVAILGDINELGPYAEEIHRNVGKHINNINLNYLITIGNNSKYIYEEAAMKNSIHFNTKKEAYPYIKSILKKGDVVLVKASNGHKFSEIVDYIKNNC